MEREKALEFLKRTADGIATMFGNKCEVAIHDMEKDDPSIIYMTNKQVNGNIVDELDYTGKQEINGVDLINRQGVSKNSHLIKSSLFHLDGDGYHFGLSINYDYTNLVMAHNVLSDLIYTDNNLDKDTLDKDETLEKQLENLFNEAIDYIGKPTVYMRKKERVEMIKYLQEKGAFSIHKSIPYIAEKMNISRYTIYNYLREIKGKEVVGSK